MGLWRTATERGDTAAVFGDEDSRAVTEKVERDAEPGVCCFVAYPTVFGVAGKVKFDANPTTSRHLLQLPAGLLVDLGLAGLESADALPGVAERGVRVAVDENSDGHDWTVSGR